ncbi:MAG: threonine synthase [Chitinophagaceae bacterium]|nr:threonine synthase [Chitinophagaceae bacterium]
MKVYSSQKKSPTISFQEALFKSIAPDKGLYIPTIIPEVPKKIIDTANADSIYDIFLYLAQSLIGDEIPPQKLAHIVRTAFSFEIPIVSLEENIFCMELFHGPTYSFKDFGGRFMAGCMEYFLEKEEKEVTILVATSGDTGSAIANAFYQVKGVRVVILYPKNKVTPIQEKQFTTLGKNITAIEIDGNFDDCQRMVKEAFADKELEKKNLTSANSINIGRILPQSFYYWYAYISLKKNISSGDKCIFAVPCGNLGNLFGGLVAKKMGLPIDMFYAASNANDIFPKYLETGVFQPKSSVSTIANAMDVGNPNNFERILSLYNHSYSSIKKDIMGFAYTDEEIAAGIRYVYEKHNALLCPHSVTAYLSLKKQITTKTKGLFLATAHAAKFPEVIYSIIPDATLAIPQRMQEVLNLPKVFIPLPPLYPYLKDFLYGSN